MTFIPRAGIREGIPRTQEMTTRNRKAIDTRAAINLVSRERC